MYKGLNIKPTPFRLPRHTKRMTIIVVFIITHTKE